MSRLSSRASRSPAVPASSLPWRNEFICTGCGREESTEGAYGALPHGWKECENDAHYCLTCQVEAGAVV